MEMTRVGFSLCHSLSGPTAQKIKSGGYKLLLWTLEDAYNSLLQSTHAEHSNIVVTQKMGQCQWYDTDAI